MSARDLRAAASWLNSFILNCGVVAALGVIAANLANVEFATPITILGFGAMLLVLLVDLSETTAGADVGRDSQSKPT